MKIDSFPLTNITKVKRNAVYRAKGFRGHLSSAAVESSASSFLPDQEFLGAFQESDFLLLYKNNAFKKGETLLALLTALRIDLLNGNIPYSRIQALHHFLHSLPENPDSLLQEILDEITLRVHIELAKIEEIS